MFRVIGDLTIRGTTREVTLACGVTRESGREYPGVGERVSFSGRTKDRPPRLRTHLESGSGDGRSPGRERDQDLDRSAGGEAVGRRKDGQDGGSGDPPPTSDSVNAVPHPCHQGHGPKQIEIHPRGPEEPEPHLLIHDCRDRPGHQQVARRMYHRGGDPAPLDPLHPACRPTDDAHARPRAGGPAPAAAP